MLNNNIAYCYKWDNNKGTQLHLICDNVRLDSQRRIRNILQNCEERPRSRWLNRYINTTKTNFIDENGNICEYIPDWKIVATNNNNKKVLHLRSWSIKLARDGRILTIDFLSDKTNWIKITKLSKFMSDINSLSTTESIIRFLLRITKTITSYEFRPHIEEWLKKSSEWINRQDLIDFLKYAPDKE